MIRIFYGDDRATISAKIKREFGEDYEVFDGENLKFEDLPSIFLGTSLFAEKRKILVKDLSGNHDVFEKLPEFLNTTHDVIIWETKLDKRTSTFKEMKKAGVEIFEYKLLESTNKNVVFNVFDAAICDGKRAVKMVEAIENEQDPYMFFGLLASQAIKKYEWKQGAKEKRVLKELSKLDMQMKSTAVQPWVLIKAFLIRLSSL
ncbi:hypothetical protein IKG45_03635 [Candidatus Saccharibacteria bacterium]|nr:hypothetical protein [Candidatus Saccharibacteria bacterium]